MEDDFKVNYGVSKLFSKDYKPTWTNEYMDAIRNGIITADYIKEGSSCNIDRLKKKVKKDGNEINHIGSGEYANVYMIDLPNDTRFPDNVYVMKNSKYEHEKDNIYDPIISTNSEVKMLRLLNNLMFDGVTPHILLYIKHAQCDTCKKPSMRLITEVCKSDVGQMDDEKWPFLEDIEFVIFQVLFTLDAIHSYYPDWRHNDLHIENVFLDKVEKKNYYYYAYGKYYRLYTNICAKISDFGHSHLPNIVENKLVFPDEKYDWDPTEFGTRPSRNQYYDMHSFLNAIKVEFIDDEAESTLNQNMQDLINEMIPLKYQTSFKVTKTRIKRIKNKNLENDCLVPDDELHVPKDAFKFFKHFEINKEDIPENEHVFCVSSLNRNEKRPASTSSMLEQLIMDSDSDQETKKQKI